MTDGDEGEFAFRWNAICIDCSPDYFDQEVAFYRDLLATQVAEREQRWAAMRDPRSGMWVNVQADDAYVPPVWPDQVPAQTKMMHFEVRVEDVPQAVTHAVAIGAREAPWQPADRDPARLRVMLDPAGHPFCLWC